MSPTGRASRVLAASAALVALHCNGSRSGFSDRVRDFPNETPSGDAGCSGLTRCSRDLRSVLDACGTDEHVLEECPSEQACKDGACVPACEATGGADSVGCEFRAVAPEGEVTDACFAAFVSNTWSTPAHLELELAGRALDVKKATRLVGPASGTAPITYLPFEGELQPGQTAIVFLAQSSPVPGQPLELFIRCPEGITPAVTTPLGVGGTGRRQSFGIKSSVPLTAYSIYPYGGGRSAVASASLLLPVRTWGKDHVVVSPWERLIGPPAAPTLRSSPGLQIVATEDATTVTVQPSAEVFPRGDVPGITPGSSATYTLSAGEVLQVVQQQELDGTLISSDKPVGYWATHECMFVPTNIGACDMSSTQLAPTTAWGTRYAAAPPPSRSTGPAEIVPFRLVAARNGTRLTYRPYRPVDAPEALEGGRIAVFSASDPFVIESQDSDHPIAIYGYMAGGNVNAEGWGDPELVPIVPTDQYLDRYVFLVDPTYAKSSLSVVRTAKDGVFPDVTLDCLGKLSGFRRIDDVHETAIVRFDAKPGEPGCGVGRHEITGTGPFTMTVWGVDWYSSYGYPGGMGLRPLNAARPDPVR